VLSFRLDSRFLVALAIAWEVASVALVRSTERVLLASTAGCQLKKLKAKRGYISLFLA